MDTPRHYSTAEIYTIKIKQENMEYYLEVYTDDSKRDAGVGARIAFFVQHKPVHQLQFRLHDHCSNNQAEQLAILKALEFIETNLQVSDNQKTVALHTDSKISLDSLANHTNNLIVAIREETRRLKTQNFIWIQAHNGTVGNEAADYLAKEVAGNSALPVNYNRKPASAVISELQVASLNKWEDEWHSSQNGAVTKLFLPSVKYRLRISLPHTDNITTFLTGHGKLNSYF